MAGHEEQQGDGADALLEGLTPSQRAAVLHDTGPLLVLAGPGSGKTRVITRRIARLIETGLAAPWQVLAVTFTNKAAGEMRHRVASLLGGEESRLVRGLTVTTFHSLCVRLLRRYAEQSGLAAAGVVGPSFTIYDADDQSRLMKTVITELGLSTTNFPPRNVLSAISEAKNNLMDADAFLRNASDFFSRQVARAYSGYQTQLRRAGAVDFDDLLLLTARMLRESEAVRAEVQGRYRYLLVDEYQDTNRAQLVIASLIAGEGEGGGGPNICVVGDPDQSIYGWRGADIANILQFEEQYRGCKLIALGENFRSRAPILAVADRLIRRNKQRKHKPLTSTRGGGARVQAVLCRDEHHEARLVLDWIRRLKSESDAGGGSYRDFAVFYRTNALSRVMEESLRGAGVPYTIVRGTAFYDREEVRHALGYLRLAANCADGVSLERVVNTPARGISDATYERFASAAAVVNGSVYELMRTPSALPGLATRAAAAVAKFVSMVDGWTAALDGYTPTAAASAPDEVEERSLLSPEAEPEMEAEPEAVVPATSGGLGAFVERVIRESGLEDLYRRTADDDRLENLAELVSSAVEFEAGYAPEVDAESAEGEPVAPGLRALLEGYLERAALVADSDAIDPTLGAVTLMTLHAAKGLEYPNVAVIGLEEGVLPHMRAVQAPSDAQMEEERRLAFVGITRAMERLLLTSSAFRTIRGVPERSMPSRFLDELKGPEVEFSDQAGYSAGRRDDDDADDGGHRDDDELRTFTSGGRSTGGGTPAGVRPEFAPGKRVRHPQFGVGTVESFMGGSSARVRVNFRDVGVKTLVLEYARLTPL